MLLRGAAWLSVSDVAPVSLRAPRAHLSRAAGYLSTTSKNVRQIARLVGYDNEASFSKAFRRAFGRPPGQYRHQQLTARILDH